MSATDYTLELETAVEAVKQAAIVCQAVQKDIKNDVLEKDDKSPVTVADFASQAIVCKIIGDKFKNDPVIGEEGSQELRLEKNSALLNSLVERVNSVVTGAPAEDILGWIDRGGQKEYTERFWTLDPIDGTKGFLRGDQYAISLALIVKGEMVAGALCTPNLHVDLNDETSKKGVVLYAQKGGGTYRTTLDNDAPQKVTVSEVAKSSDIRVCESVEKAHSSHDDSFKIASALKITANPVRIDSQAKYATVATGQSDAYLRLPRDGKYREKIWDHAGGVITVTEAGGEVTDVFGKPLDFSKGYRLEENTGVIVSNKKVHKMIIDTIAELN
ncbi:MAG: 3'(2'),5'-bisphosphate nucleotidase, partial [Deltaproteobacteria bacterium]|nr:3'(2'),5'-bisphosphate nucleotidase [Deltaproteobacteria bacterium]